MEYELFRKIVESCHLNFLIGSGSSRPFLGTLGTIEQMLTVTREFYYKAKEMLSESKAEAPKLTLKSGKLELVVEAICIN